MMKKVILGMIAGVAIASASSNLLFFDWCNDGCDNGDTCVKWGSCLGKQWHTTCTMPVEFEGVVKGRYTETCNTIKDWGTNPGTCTKQSECVGEIFLYNVEGVMNGKLTVKRSKFTSDTYGKGKKRDHTAEFAIFENSDDYCDWLESTDHTEGVYAEDWAACEAAEEKKKRSSSSSSTLSTITEVSSSSGFEEYNFITVVDANGDFSFLKGAQLPLTWEDGGYVTSLKRWSSEITSSTSDDDDSSSN